MPRHAARGQPFRGAIVLSHLHWDHVHGLPFFEAADRDDARTTVYLPDPDDGSKAVDVLARGMSPPHFPVRPDDLRGSWSFVGLAPGTLEIEGYTVTVNEIPHKGGRTYGVRVSDGESTVAYLPDHCPSDVGPGPHGWGEYHASALALADHADVLIHDAQFTARELATKRYLGHAAAEYAVALGRAAGVTRVLLFHHQPDRTDDALDALAHSFHAPPLVSVASESLVLDLP